MANKDINHLLFILNCTLVAFSISYNINITSLNKREIYQIYYNQHITPIYLIILLGSGIFILLNNINTAYIAVTNGYMALYENQAEAYQTPTALLFSSIYISGLAILFSSKFYKIIDEKMDRKIHIYFKILFMLFVTATSINILTGSRAVFINAILLIIWVNYGNKKIVFSKYILLICGLFSIASFSNIIASLSGARSFSNTEDSQIFSLLTSTLYEQGISLMVVNSSFDIDEVSILGYFKTILPGIQILYPFFGITERHLFDWSSSLAYQANSIMYQQGFGLGWSIISDFYLLSFKIIPIYIIIWFIFGIFIKFISNDHNGPFSKGLLFITACYIFSISRSSISPMLFSYIIYTISYSMIITADKSKIHN